MAKLFEEVVSGNVGLEAEGKRLRASLDPAES